MIWVIITFAFSISAAWIAGQWCQPSSVSLRLVSLLSLFAAFILLAVQLAGLAEILGLIEIFSLSRIAVASALIFAVTYLTRRALRSAASVSEQTVGQGVRRVGAWAVSYPATSTLALAGAICAGSWAIFLINALVSYTAGWDGLTYHLPVALSWLTNESMAIPEFGGWKFALPSNGEVGMMLFIGAGFERLSFLFNLLTTGVGAISVFLLGRRLSGSGQPAALATAVFALLPMVQHQATSSYIDLYGSCMILAGVAVFIHRHDFSPDPTAKRPYIFALAVTGLCWGIAVGAKPIFYAYGALCCSFALLVILFDKEKYGRFPLLPGIVLVGFMLLPCVYWLLRAYIATGNPFYPVEVRMFGQLIFEGYSVDTITVGNPEKKFVRSTLAWFIYPWLEFKDIGFAYGTGSGLGAGWAVFVPAGLIATALIAFRNFREERGRTAALLLLLFVAMVLLWSFGLRRLPRFGLPYALLACIFAAPIFAYLIETRLKAAQILIVVALGTSAMLSTFSPLHDILGRIRANTWSRAAVFEIPAMVDTFPPGTVIWNAGAQENMTFPLAGNDLTNRVISWHWIDLDVARRFIAEQKVDYVFDRAPFCCEELETIGGRLVFDDIVEPNNPWRVWAMPSATQ